MSLINLKKLLASVMLVLLLTSEVFATQGFRPWAPYQRDQFGGGARRTEGVYGTLEGVFYTFAPVKNIVIGDNDTTGGVREAYTGNMILNQYNTIDTNHLGAVSGMGTRAEIGNFRDHHGWSIGGYRVNMSNSMEFANASMVINDTSDMSAFTITSATADFSYIYNGQKGFDKVPGNGTPMSINKVGPSALWGWYIVEQYTPGVWRETFDRVQDPQTGAWTYVSTGWVQLPGESIWIGQLAPLPINFDNTRVTTQMEHWVIDALYTYRCHPTRIGNLDMFGGVRYMEIDDSLLFLGEGIPWKGVTVDPNTGDLTGSATGMGSILGDSDWRFKADNHIIAPQIGGRWSRTNNRWTLSAEGRFLAGFNQQNLRSKGTMGSLYNNVDTSIFSSTNATNTSINYTDYNIYPWSPIGIINSTRSFNHSATKHAFSPGVEVKVNANWQLTNAVGINFGVTSMWVDKIARGSKINDYSIYNDQFFGLKDSGFTDFALMYGFNVGVTINRF